MEKDTQNQSYERETPWHRNETLIKVSRGIFIFFAVIGIVILFLALTLKKEVEDRDASRNVNSSLAFVDQEFPVHLDIELDDMPDCSIPDISKTITVILDVSGSMDGIPLSNEIEGTVRIINQVDFGTSSVSLIKFSDVPQELISFSADRNVLLMSLSGIQAGGGTNIAAALQVASESLDQHASVANEEKYVLLFTDGGENAGDAIAQAQNLSNSGAELFIIGLRGGEDFNETVLSQLAPDSSHLLIADNADQIIEMFLQVANLIQLSPITEVQALEPINTEAFSVQDEYLASPYLFVNNGGLTDENVYSLEYTLEPEKIGLYDVVLLGSSLTFVDCEGALHEYMIGNGPKVLVLPPLIPLLICYLLPLLLSGLFAFWPRKPEKIWREPNHAPDYEEPKFPYMLSTISHANKNNHDESNSYSPTLVIGLGRTGYETLNLLKKQLIEIGEGDMPRGVQLLWIGAKESDLELVKKVYLDKNETHIINPEFDRINIETDNPGIRTNFSWWKNQTGGEINRTHGRMAFFYDVLFSTAKSLKKHFENISNLFSTQGNTAYRVFIVASPAETECAMMPDIVYWMRCQFRGKIRRVLPWLLLEPLSGSESAQDFDTAQLRYATMREIQRFMVSPDQLMETEDGRYDIHDGYLFDGCMIFDHSSNPAAIKSNVIRSVSEQMLVLMEEGVADKFDQDMTDFMGKINKDYDHTMFVTSNSFCFYLPVEPIRRACEIKMLKDIFFAEGDEKNIPPGMFTKYIEPNDSSATNRKMVLDFLNWKFDELDNSPFQMIFDLIQTGWDEGVADHLPGNFVRGYQWKLVLYLNSFMNGGLRFQDNQKSASFYKAKALLSEMNSVWKELPNQLQHVRAVRGKEHLITEFTQYLPGLEKVTKLMLDEIGYWENFVYSRSAANSIAGKNGNRFRTSNSTIRSLDIVETDDEHEKTFVQYVEDSNSERMDELNDALKLTDTKSVVLDPIFEINGNNDVGEIINYYYHEYLLVSENNEVNELTSLSSNLGWHWEITDEEIPQLQLIVKDIKKSEKLETQPICAYHYDEFVPGYSTISSMLPLFSRKLRSKMNLTELLRQQENKITEILDIEKTDRLLNYKLINDSSYCQQRPFLMHPNKSQALSWAEKMVTQNFEIMEIENPTCAMAIWFVYKVPVSIIQLIESDKDSYFALPELHVYPAEQYAVEREMELGNDAKNGKLFHPRLVRMMSYPELFSVTLYSLLFGWITTTEDELGSVHYVVRAPGIPEFALECAEVITPENIEDALQNMTILIPWKCLDSYHPLHMNNLSTTISALQQAIADYRKQPFKDRKDRYDFVDENIMRVWDQSNNVVLGDLSRLLRLLIKQESKY
jgi:uncharacterized protein YegL